MENCTELVTVKLPDKFPKQNISRYIEKVTDKFINKCQNINVINISIFIKYKERLWYIIYL